MKWHIYKPDILIIYKIYEGADLTLTKIINEMINLLKKRGVAMIIISNEIIDGIMFDKEYVVY